MRLKELSEFLFETALLWLLLFALIISFVLSEDPDGTSEFGRILKGVKP